MLALQLAIPELSALGVDSHVEGNCLIGKQGSDAVETHHGAEVAQLAPNAPGRVRTLVASPQHDGLEIHSTAQSDHGRKTAWTFGMRLVGMRRGEQFAPQETGVLVPGDHGFAYVSDSAVESYQYAAGGLEQAFTIHEPMLSDDSTVRTSQLELVLEMGGNLCPMVQPDGVSAHFRDADGESVLSYTGLKAWDANGEPLTAHLRANGDLLSIVVSDQGAAYPIVIDPLIGCLRARLSPTDLAMDNRFGFAMASDGDTLVVGAVRSFPTPLNSAYVYRLSGTTWTREAKLFGSATQDDGFGCCVSISGDTIAVGAPSANDLGNQSGAVYVFVRTGNHWTQQARLLASDGAPIDWFGYSVALQSDRLVVGSVRDDDSGTDSGSVYVFERIGTAWSQTAKLLASAGQASDQFGSGVDQDGSLVAIAAPGSLSSTGRAYVFRTGGTGWTQEAVLTPPGSPIGFFGSSIAASNGRIVVGERGLTTSPGTAHVFQRVGVNWQVTASLFPLDPTSNDFFGWSVDILNGRLLIGAPGKQPLGAAYVFDELAGVWSQAAKLNPFTSSLSGHMGISVAINTSGVCAGDPYDSELYSGAGAAYVFSLVEDHAVHCLAKTNSLGCSPRIAAVGAASANASQGFVVSCSQVINNTSGLLFHSIAGRSNTPFQGGTLCMTPPIRRTPALNSGGNPAPAHDCSGSFSIDMNAFARGLLGGAPFPELSVIGTVVQCQWWGRDQGFAAPFNTMLSDALEYTVCQ